MWRVWRPGWGWREGESKEIQNLKLGDYKIKEIVYYLFLSYMTGYTGEFSIICKNFFNFISDCQIIDSKKNIREDTIEDFQALVK